MAQQTTLSPMALPGPVYVFLAKASAAPAAVGGPYRVVEGEVFVAGRTQGELVSTGAAEGELAIAGVTAGEIDGRHR